MNNVRFGAACVSALLLAGPASGASAGTALDRRVQPAFARRVPAAGHQGAEARREARPRDQVRGAHARRLYRAVQLRRIQARRQRVADDGRPCRYPRRQGDVSVQPVRFLGRRRHRAARDQDAEGSRRQGRRRRQGHHQLGDVRLVRPPARRRYLEIPGGQYGDTRPDRLRAGRPRHRGAALGAGLYHADDEEAGDADHRPRDCRELEEVRRQHAIFPISASPRTSTGRRRIRSWFKNSTPPTRTLRSGSPPTPTRQRK